MTINQITRKTKALTYYIAHNIASGEAIAQAAGEWIDVKDWVPRNLFVDFGIGAATNIVLTIDVLIVDDSTAYAVCLLSGVPWTVTLTGSANYSIPLGQTVPDSLALLGKGHKVRVNYAVTGTRTTTTAVIGLSGSPIL